MCFFSIFHALGEDFISPCDIFQKGEHQVFGIAQKVWTCTVRCVAVRFFFFAGWLSGWLAGRSTLQADRGGWKHVIRGVSSHRNILAER